MNGVSGISPSFGSIQSKTSRMSLEQKRLNDDFYKEIKSNDTYKALEEFSDVDVYVLPKAKKSEIEVRLMDPYSGNFIKKEDGHYYSHTISSPNSEKIREVSGNVVNTICQVVNGNIQRPNPNLDSIYNGTNAMAKIRPDKYKSFDQDVRELQESGLKLKDALKLALSNFIALYHIDNEDAKF